jgi:hypothetical protein
LMITSRNFAAQLETPAKKFTKPTGPKVCHQIV